MLRQSTLIFPAFQQGQAPQEDIQKKNIVYVCMYAYVCGMSMTSGKMAKWVPMSLCF